MLQEFRPVMVYTSCDDQDACREIARLVLDRKLAACVQLMAPMTSFYWWNDQIAEDSEYLMTMKGERSLFDELVSAIRSIHPYDVPEIIATDIIALDHDYAIWMRETIGHG